jgi:hypothetical protein
VQKCEIIHTIPQVYKAHESGLFLFAAFDVCGWLGDTPDLPFVAFPKQARLAHHR